MNVDGPVENRFGETCIMVYFICLFVFALRLSITQSLKNNELHTTVTRLGRFRWWRTDSTTINHTENNNNNEESIDYWLNTALISWLVRHKAGWSWHRSLIGRFLRVECYIGWIKRKKVIVNVCVLFRHVIALISKLSVACVNRVCLFPPLACSLS